MDGKRKLEGCEAWLQLHIGGTWLQAHTFPPEAASHTPAAMPYPTPTHQMP
jgi:hypothetical protein